MPSQTKIVLSFLALILGIFQPISLTRASEADYTVSPSGEISSISKAIQLANEGDTIVVKGGIYKERVVIDKSLSLIGKDRPIVDGEGKGTVILIQTPGCEFKGFEIRGTGSSLTVEDSGIVLDSAAESTVENNYLKDVLFGIYVKNSPNTVIRNNVIIGKDLPLPDRGDGIRLWYSSETLILNNRITDARDLVIWWSSNTLIKGNRVENGRYGLHYMYSDNNVFEDNVFAGNSVGGFLMYSGRIEFYRNVFARNRGLASGYGVGFKDLDYVVAEENLLIDNHIGIYLDNSPHLIDSWNRMINNVVAFNDIGGSFMPSIERNIFIENSFIENTEQIQVRGGGTLSGNTWYRDERGNYWSDYVGFDQNNDGVGEIPYRAESLFEKFIDSYPTLRIFVHSPVSQAIELAAEAFPVMKPEPKVTDRYPLVTAHIPSEFKTEENSVFSPVLFVFSSFLVLIPLGLYFYLTKPGAEVNDDRSKRSN